MKPNPSRFKRKSIWMVLVIGALCAPIAICCSVIIRQSYPPETRAPQEFPNTDLVYAASGGLGFVNADGSDPTYLDFSAKMAGGRFTGYSGQAMRPVITGDGQVVITQVNPNGYFGMKNSYPLALWRAGALPLICWEWSQQPLALLSSDQKHIFIETEQEIALYNLKDCGTDNPPEKIFQNISGVPSPDLRYVAYTEIRDNDQRIIKVLNLMNKEERLIGIGDYPAWSPDSRWLAYTGTDGIYVVNLDEEAKSHQVLSYLNPSGKIYPTYLNINDIAPPEAAWSSDGVWLVYHKRTGNMMSSGPAYYAIYKLNIATGKESKIIDGGVYPYWRWPAQP